MKEGSGMTFLLVIMSKGSLLLGESGKDEEHSYDIEKLMEQFIGVLCFRSYVISNAKVLQPSQILNGWVIYTEEATNPDFSIA